MICIPTQERGNETGHWGAVQSVGTSLNESEWARWVCVPTQEHGDESGFRVCPRPRSHAPASLPLS